MVSLPAHLSSQLFCGRVQQLEHHPVPQPLNGKTRRKATGIYPASASHLQRLTTCQLSAPTEGTKPLTAIPPCGPTLEPTALRNLTPEPTAKPSPSSTITWNQNPATWRMRLLTSEDWLHLHATSSTAFLISGLGIEALNAFSLASSGELWIPDSWGLVVPVIVTAMVAQVTGIKMALQFRPPGPVQNGFVAAAVGNLTTILTSIAATEFFPEELRSPAAKLLLTVGCFGFMVINTWQVVAEGRDMLRSRKVGEGSMVNAVQNWLVYILPPAMTLPFLLAATSAVFGGSRDWALANLELHPTYYGFVLHNAILTSLWANIGVFAVTLRDKLLIGPLLEKLLIGLPGLPVAAIYVKYVDVWFPPAVVLWGL